MTKKIFLTILVIVALVGTCVYANEVELSPTTTAEQLQNTALLGENTTDPNAGIMPIDGATGSSEGGTSIPEEYWREDGISGETVNHDVFIGEDVVQLSNKVIEGNVFLFGETIDASTLQIYGDLYVFGQTANIKDTYVSGNVYIAGSSVVLSDINCIGNVYGAGSSVNVSGTLTQDMFLAGSTVTLAEGVSISRNIYAGGSTVELGDTYIGRDANVTGTTINSANAVIGGNLNQEIVEEDIADSDSTGFSFENAVSSVISNVIKAVVVCGFIFLFANEFIDKNKNANVAKFLVKTTAKGFGLLFLIPIIALLLIATGFGVGIGLIVVLLYIAILAISTSLVAVVITVNIVKEGSNLKLYGISIVVAGILALVQKIPVIGAIVSILVGLVGMGLIFSRNKKEEKEEVVTTTESV